MGEIRLGPYQFKGRSNMESDGKWYLRVSHYSTISAEELSRLAAEDSRIDRSEVQYVISAIVKQVKELVLLGHSINIPELGTLSLSAESHTVDNLEDVRLDRMLSGFKLNLRVTDELRAALKQISLRMERG